MSKTSMHPARGTGLAAGPLRAGLCGALVALLAACGGGGGAAPAAGGGAGGGGAGGSTGQLTISAANPATHNTTLDLSKAGTAGFLPHSADNLSSVPYCEVYWENVPGANGQSYALQVMYHPADKVALKVVAFANGYTPEATEGGRALVGVVLDTAARKMTFTGRVLSGAGGVLGTLDGVANWPAAEKGCG